MVVCWSLVPVGITVAFTAPSLLTVMLSYPFDFAVESASAFVAAKASVPTLRPLRVASASRAPSLSTGDSSFPAGTTETAASVRSIGLTDPIVKYVSASAPPAARAETVSVIGAVAGNARSAAEAAVAIECNAICRFS